MKTLANFEKGKISQITTWKAVAKNQSGDGLVGDIFMNKLLALAIISQQKSPSPCGMCFFIYSALLFAVSHFILTTALLGRQVSDVFYSIYKQVSNVWRG